MWGFRTHSNSHLYRMSTVTCYICLGEYIPNTVTIFNPEVAVLANVYILDNILLASRFPARIVSDDLDDSNFAMLLLLQHRRNRYII